MIPHSKGTASVSLNSSLVSTVLKIGNPTPIATGLTNRKKSSISVFLIKDETKLAPPYAIHIFSKLSHISLQFLVPVKQCSIHLPMWTTDKAVDSNLNLQFQFSHRTILSRSFISINQSNPTKSIRQHDGRAGMVSLLSRLHFISVMPETGKLFRKSVDPVPEPAEKYRRNSDE